MHLSYRAGWVFFRLFLGAYFRARYLNHENVPATGPVILAANHASYIDPPLIGAGLHRTVSFLARDTLFRFPVMGSILRTWKVVPVDREGGGATGLRMIMDRLNQGNAILLFPEGTRSSNGELQPARSGVGLIVIKSTAPVVPVRVFGTAQAYGRRHRIPRPLPISVKFGTPLPFTELRTEAATCTKTRLKQIYQQVADEIMAAIGRLTPFEEKTRFP